MVTIGEASSRLPDNRVSNTKYTALSFLPLFLLEQFGTPMNMYFLLIAVLQLWRAITPVNPITTWAPLLIVLSISAAKEIMEDRRRAAADFEANMRKYCVFRGGLVLPSCLSKDIRPGDIILIRDHEEMPCDLALLRVLPRAGTGANTSTAFVETANLDGETDLKPRMARSETQELSLAQMTGCADTAAIPEISVLLGDIDRGGSSAAVVSAPGGRLAGHITCEPPNSDLYRFDAAMTADLPGSGHGGVGSPSSHSTTRKCTVPLSASQLLQHGTVLRKSGAVLAVAVYTGRDTKLNQNRTAATQPSSSHRQTSAGAVRFVRSPGARDEAARRSNGSSLLGACSAAHSACCRRVSRSPVCGGSGHAEAGKRSVVSAAINRFVVFVFLGQLALVALFGSLGQAYSGGAVPVAASSAGRSGGGDGRWYLAWPAESVLAHGDHQDVFLPADVDDPEYAFVGAEASTLPSAATASLVSALRGAGAFAGGAREGNAASSWTGRRAAQANTSSVGASHEGRRAAADASRPGLRPTGSRRPSSLVSLPARLGAGGGPPDAVVMQPWYTPLVLPLRFLLLSSMLIPISLKVSLDLVKVLHGRWIEADAEMYDEASGKAPRAANTALCEDLGRIQYVLTDKTGTLTENRMIAAALGVRGALYAADEAFREACQQAAEAVDGAADARSSAEGAGASYLPTAAAHAPVLDALRVLALCNAVEPSPAPLGGPATPAFSSVQPKHSSRLAEERESSDSDNDSDHEEAGAATRMLRGSKSNGNAQLATPLHAGTAAHSTSLPSFTPRFSYTSASPDEEALVGMAAACGVALATRRHDRSGRQHVELQLSRSLTGRHVEAASEPCRSDSESEWYEVLHVLEFTSARKCMSVLLRRTDTGRPLERTSSQGLADSRPDSPAAPIMAAEAESRYTPPPAGHLPLSRSSSTASAASGIGRSPDASSSLMARSGRASSPGRFFASPPHTAAGVGGRGSLVGAAAGATGVTVAESSDDAAASAFSYSAGSVADGSRIAYSGVVSDDLVLVTKGADEVIMRMLAPLVVGAAADADNAEERDVRAATTAQLGSLAARGLRTLLLAGRSISPTEYAAWLPAWEAAQREVHDREAAVARASALLEQRLLLLGCTAIEDALQAGVPEAVQALREAGMRVWMLTGDKAETAVQVARACRLLPVPAPNASAEPTHSRLASGDVSLSVRSGRDVAAAGMTHPASAHASSSGASAGAGAVAVTVNSVKPTGSKRIVSSVQVGGGGVAQSNGHGPVFTLRASDELDMSKQLHALAECLGMGMGVGASSSSDGGGTRSGTSVYQNTFAPHEWTLVVDGITTLRLLLAGGGDAPWAPAAAFRTMASACGAVLCCRCLPMQKAALVRLLRGAGHVTLSIGDGGNDVGMITAANVGVGLEGKEGKHAARAADFALPRFAALQRLVLVHGRLAHYRTSLVAGYTFHKSACVGFLQLAFNAACAYSGCSLLDAAALTSYNMLFTFVPAMLLALDADVTPKQLATKPSHYAPSQRGDFLSNRSFGAWMVRAVVQALIILAVFAAGVGHAGGGSCGAGASADQTRLAYGVFTALVLTQLATVLTAMRRPTVVNVAAVAAFTAVYLLMLAVRDAATGEALLPTMLSPFQPYLWCSLLAVAGGMGVCWLLPAALRVDALAGDARPVTAAAEATRRV